MSTDVYTSVDSQPTYVSTIDRDSVDIPSDRKPVEQVQFFAFYKRRKTSVRRVRRASYIIILSSNLLPLYGKL